MKITTVGQYIQILLYTIPTVFATIFSGFDYIKAGKDLFKEEP